MAKKKQKAPRKPKPPPAGKPGKPKKKKPGSGGEEGWRGGEHELRAALAARGLRIKAVQADGNCFFRAVGDQLEGDAGVLRHLEYRQRVAAHVEAHRAAYQPFICEEEDDAAFEKYLRELKEDGTWAGNVELQAVAQEFRVSVLVYQDSGPALYVANENAVATIRLSYHDGDHYNSLRGEKDFGAGPPAAVVVDPEAPADAGALAEQEKVAFLLRSTACEDEAHARRVLRRHRGSVDDALEALIEDPVGDAPSSAAPAAGAEEEEEEEGGPPPPPPGPDRARIEKPARNKRCPCGSKLKYKVCCGRKPAPGRPPAAAGGGGRPEGGAVAI